MGTRTRTGLMLLTAGYLIFELGFNARLLDAMGTDLDPGKIDGLEVYGRLLTGVAMALLVLQASLWARARWAVGGTGVFVLATAALCAGTVFGVYQGLLRLTDYLVDDSSEQFRRASMSATLAKSSLIDGSLRLGALPDESAGFKGPQGKAFVALLPLFAVSMESFDSEIAAERKPALLRALAARVGGEQGYYAKYRDAIEASYAQWRQYRQADPELLAERVERSLAKQQDQAWSRYQHDLGRRGMTPYTIPFDMHDRVRRKVQASVPVADDWLPDDEQGFREAVARKARGALSARAPGSRNVAVPPGLEWEAFLAHASVQETLRAKLGLPRQVVLRPRYASGDQFEREVYRPLLERQLAQRWPAYDGVAADYADHARFAGAGRDAARAVIVAPLALFFSLLGALTHMTKLALMLSLALLGSMGASNKARSAAVVAVLLVALGGATALCYTDNAITASRAYINLESGTARSAHAPRKAAFKARLLHGVAVGQGLFFPLNEAIRTRVLGGLNYGFDPLAPKEKT